MTTSKEIKIPVIAEREENIEKVICFLERYSGSTEEDIAKGLNMERLDVYQALEASMVRGDVCSESLGNIEVFRLRGEEDQQLTELLSSLWLGSSD